MEQEQLSIPMLHMFTHPVFRVEKGVIQEVNNAAQQWMIKPGTPVDLLMCTGREDYLEFTGGALSLSLQINGNSYMASIFRNDHCDVFHIQVDPAEESLRSMALTAQCIREPLADIMTVADQLFADRKLLENEYSRSHISHMNRSLFRLLRVVGNMSDVGNGGFSPARMELLDVTDIIDEAVADAQAVIDQTDHRLDYNRIHRPLCTMVNRDLLVRAIYNLISNAVKYSPAGSAIKIRLTQADSRLMVSVENPAEPISAAMLGTMFSRYKRQPGIEDGRNGLGLGISMIRTAAAAHNGSLLMTQDKKGSVCFTLTLALRSDCGEILRSPLVRFDYAGGRSHALLELSDILPAGSYENIN